MPVSAEELIETSFSYRGKLTKAEVEKATDYNDQLKLTFETPDTKKGIMFEWYSLGGAFKKTRRVDKNSNYGILLEITQTLLGEPVNWKSLVGKWFIMEKRTVDRGDLGVFKIGAPIYIGDEMPEMGTLPDSGLAAEWEGYPIPQVHQALGLMAGSNEADFKKSIAKSSLKGTDIQAGVVEGTFVSKVIEAGFATVGDDGLYEVTSMPEADDAVSESAE